MNPLTSLILWASVQVLLFSLVGVLAFLLAQAWAQCRSRQCSDRAGNHGSDCVGND